MATEKTNKPISDVEKPGTSAPAATSKPVILSHGPAVQDPMVTTPIDDVPAEKPSGSALMSHKTLQPLKSQDKEKTEAKEEEPKEAQKDEVASDDKALEGSDEPSDAGAVDALANQITDKRKEELKNDEAEKKRLELEKLIEDKKYFVPVGEAKRHRNNRWAAIVILLLVILVGSAAAMDAGFINPGFKLPFDFIKNPAAVDKAEDTPAPTVTQAPAVTRPTTTEYINKDFGFKFTHPKEWVVSVAEIPSTKIAINSGTAYHISTGQEKLTGGFVTKDFKSSASFVGFTKFSDCVDPTLSIKYNFAYYAADGVCAKVVAYTKVEGGVSSNLALLVVQKRFDKSTKTAGVEFQYAPVVIKDFNEATVKAAHTKDEVKIMTDLAKSISEL